MSSSTLSRLGPGKSRSTQGCYTCRLRRKKCDEKKPECENCKSLEITCHFGDDKPDWFDGGPKQKAEMERVKADIRLKASQRRDRKYLEMLGQGGEHHEGSHLADDDGPNDIAMRDSPDSDHQESSHHSQLSHTPHNHSTPPTSYHSSPTGNHSMFSNSTAFLSDEVKDVDLNFVMIYLDTIFPYLFPYYHNPALFGGRGWVLESLVANKAVHHTAVSLATYFYSILIMEHNAEVELGVPGYTSVCAKNLHGRLQTQLEMTLTALGQEMAELNARPVGSCPKEALICMQSIVLMCHFEVATRNEAKWMMHLDAAITLLQSQLVPDRSNFKAALDIFETQESDSSGLRLPYNTHQHALRFYTAQLLYMDVVSSVALERAPRLYGYQNNLVPGCGAKPTGLHRIRPLAIYLDEFIGFHNHTLQMLADVASIDAWAKEQRRAGALSIHSLIERADGVSQALKVVIPNWEQLASGAAGGDMPAHFAAAIAIDSISGMHPQAPDTIPGNPTHNLIWLLAVQTYLHTIINGWQPMCPEIAANVEKMTTLFQSVPRGTHLRALALPITIAGCLSPCEREQDFRDLTSSLGALQGFGTLKDGLQVMEAVWSRRCSIDETWDLAKCLNILGHSVLLV